MYWHNRGLIIEQTYSCGLKKQVLLEPSKPLGLQPSVEQNGTVAQDKH
jgi:hypothetical protein